MQTDATVRDFVNRDYRAAAVFHRYGIDFCCGGGRPLREVCRAKQLEESAVMGEISRACADDASAPPRFTDWAADDLTQYIVARHHAYCRDAMPVIEAHARKLAKVHGEANPELVEIAEIFSKVCEELDTHDNPMRVMDDDHAPAVAAMARIRELARDYAVPEHGCTTWRITLQELEAFEQDLHTHVHLENNVLFPKARALAAPPVG